MNSENTVLAGFGTADTTPKQGTLTTCRINNFADIIHSPLNVRVCIIRRYDIGFAVVSADVLSLFKKTVSDIRAAVSDASGISKENIFVNASHSHSTPYLHNDANSMLNRYSLSLFDDGYYSYFLERCAAAAKAAAENLNPVRLKTSTGFVKHVASNRRVLREDGSIGIRFGRRVPEALVNAPEGLVDPRVECVWFEKISGELCGVIFNYACHATSHSSAKEICWDYPGFARETLEMRFNAPAVFLQGCAGNISPGKYAVTTPLNDATMLGSRVADAVIKSYDTAKPADIKKIKVSISDVKIPIKPSLYESKDKESYDGYISDYKSGAIGSSKLISVTEKLVLAENYGDGTYDTEICVARMGNILMVFFPGEMFVEAALYLKEKYKDCHMLIMAYQDAAMQYLPNIEAFSENGGFETGDDWCFSPSGTMEYLRDKAAETIDPMIT